MLVHSGEVEAMSAPLMGVFRQTVSLDTYTHTHSVQLLFLSVTASFAGPVFYGVGKLARFLTRSFFFFFLEFLIKASYFLPPPKLIST